MESDGCLSVAAQVFSHELHFDALTSLLNEQDPESEVLTELLCLSALYAGSGSIRGLAMARMLLAQGVGADEPSVEGHGSLYRPGDTPLKIAIYQTAFVKRAWHGRFATVEAGDMAAMAEGGTPLHEQLGFIAELVSRGASPNRKCGSSSCSGDGKS